MADISSGGDVLELEHVVGYTGHFPNTLLHHPVEQNMMIYSIGAVVVIEDVTDPHKQEFLRGHDMEISALALSSNGRLVASGQVGSFAVKTRDAPVMVWDLASRRSVFTFSGLTHSVTRLTFSPDGVFLAATGENQVLLVWDLRTGEVIHSRRSEVPCSLISWGAISGNSRHPSYVLLTAYQNQTFVNRLDFDVRSMQYATSTTKCQLPSTGLSRVYTVSCVDSSGEFLLAGSTGGDFSVFSISSAIYRASVPVSSNGLLSLCMGPDCLYAGAGDGKLKKLSGRDTRWSLEAETQLEGKVVSISLSVDGRELLVGTSAGKIYRLLSSDLASACVAESHVDTVTDVSFTPDRSDVFCTVSEGGALKVWDLSDYTIITRAHFRGGAESCCFNSDDTILVGFADGFLRCVDAQSGALRWELPGAHRGAVRSVRATDRYIVTGGQDGCVRVWGRKSHELITQFSEHRKDVTEVLPDLLQPHLVHSCGADRAVLTYDLKTNKKAVSHMIRNGYLTGLSQRRDHENELVTSGSDGLTLFWDCDEVEPVGAFEDGNRARLSCVRVSPTGRFIATSGDDCQVKLYDLSTGAVSAIGVGHSAAIRRLEWSPDEKQLVSVGSDCCVCVWNFYG
eukprot:GILI01013927.1.p1 GENE.GILI01013927.1~~GILI01013927.1.p1  ORF type:complete len:623 (+),score=120.64 GILI01013927.1:91-1959(+)